MLQQEPGRSALDPDQAMKFFVKLATLASVAVASTAPADSVYPVTGWRTIVGDAALVDGSETTSSPSVTDLPADTIAASFPTVTLADGQSLTLTGSVTFAGSAGGNQFRIGLFNGPSPVVTGSGSSYAGINADAPSSGTGAVKYGNGTAANPFSSSASVSIAAMSNPGGAAPGGIAIAFSLKITRIATALDIQAELGNVGGGGTWSTSGLIQHWTPPGGFGFSFNTVAFLMGASLSSTTANYSNVEVAIGAYDSDGDGMQDSWELAHGLVVGLDDSADDPDGDGLSNLREFLGNDGIAGTDDATNPQSPDTDGDGLSDSVETGTGVFVDIHDTGTDPNNPDSDQDGANDGQEVATGHDPNDAGDAPPMPQRTRLLGIDFNRDDALGSPSQSLFRIVSGSTVQGDNAASYSKAIRPYRITISQPESTPFEFRGANGDAARAIPGGDTSLAYLVGDLIATRQGHLQVTIEGLPAGNYAFRSYHLDPFTGNGFGFAQGATANSPNTIEARIGDVLLGLVQANCLGPSGLGKTFINDTQIPKLDFSFAHDGLGPVAITLSSAESNGTESYLLVNGFEIFQTSP